MSDAQIHAFYDAATHTVSHVVADPGSRRCAIIDPVLDFDPKSGRISHLSADLLIAWVRDQQLSVDWLLETHCHADHLSAAPYLKERLGGRLAIGARITEVQQVFRRLFNDPGIPIDGQPFDHLFEDGERFALGGLTVEVMHTPGHTPACVSYRVGDDVFIGDTLFMPDYGSARCDFPGGDAATLFHSVRRLLSLPDHTRLHLCHDYPPASRPACWITTVADQKAHNVHLHEGVAESDFVALRHARDRNLAMPQLLLPSVQVNVRAGHLPAAEANGTHYLKIPLNAL
jgi:glyoxylase-like metal-dependent hydrolase (beta-lactamase superfamily II)